jgi:HPt (histidine-containing phosphotransfer) domain-containing protein
MSLAIPGIDEQKIHEIYEDDYDLFFPVLHAYIDELPGSLARLRAVSAETLPDYARVMHGVKGTSASACAEEARKTATQLQAMAKAGNLAGVLAQNEAFLNYMDTFSTRVRNWLAANGK